MSENDTPDETSTSTRIRQLDEQTVARIAAGEVVERPASAVKELLENALDADASRVEVAIEAGGTESIRVSDDGWGMSEADVRAAVRQHTTSKISDLSDLESGVSTLGFRGEALHTIGSVSRLRIRTRPRADRLPENDEHAAVGTELVYEGGALTSVEPTGCPEGTTVEVTDLFYNTPARRKFLQTTATEFAHVNRIVTRYALANPDVAVSLVHDGREVFATTGQGDLQAAVLAVYGRDVAEAMIPLELEGEALPAGPLERISGLVSHPETNRSSREYLATYVNGRAVTADAVRDGIMDAYGGQLGPDRYPFVVLFLEVPGETVDVNVHPRKREVRFDDDDGVRRAVESAVSETLLEHGLVRSSAPRGRSAPDEANVSPESSSASSSSSASLSPSDSSTPSSSSSSPASSSSPSDGPSSSQTSTVDAEQDSTESTRTAETATEPVGERAVDTDDGDERSHADGDQLSSSDSTPSRLTRATRQPSTDAPTRSGGADRNLEERWSGQPPTSSERRKFSDTPTQQTLEGEETTQTRSFRSLPSLRVLGQLQDTYLVCESADGLVLIDQHAADERVNYERLRETFAKEPTAQALASPVELEVTAIEAEAFESYREALSRLGFYANRVGERTVAVTTVPAVFAQTLEPTQLRDVLAAFIAGDHESGAETVDALADAFLGELACYPSITGNTALTEGSVFELLDALDDCSNPYTCPHGRPVLLSIDTNEIEDRFERDYPGHN